MIQNVLELVYLLTDRSLPRYCCNRWCVRRIPVNLFNQQQEHMLLATPSMTADAIKQPVRKRCIASLRHPQHDGNPGSNCVEQTCRRRRAELHDVERQIGGLPYGRLQPVFGGPCGSFLEVSEYEICKRAGHLRRKRSAGHASAGFLAEPRAEECHSGPAVESV